jgi:hypothetical protein
MKNATLATFRFILLLIIIAGCAATSGGLKFLEPPKDENVMIIGNVIVENINQEFAFDDWGMSAQIIIIGKSLDGTMNHYTVNTDEKGYYCLPNVPSGQYAIKAVILPVIGEKPVKLVNDLISSDSKFYRMRHPEQPIEYTATWLPSKTEERIINFNIIWFGLRSASISDISSNSIGEILVVKSKTSLQGKRFYDKGFPYTREDPLTHFKKKFPEAAWWSL